MSVFRYRVRGPTLGNVGLYVDASVVSIRDVRRQNDCEIDLGDDGELPALDAYMATQGFQRVGAPQTNGQLTADIMTFGALTITTVINTQFLLPFGISAALNTEIQFRNFGTRRFRSIGVKTTAGGTGGGNLTYTLRKNGVNTGITLNVLNTATTGVFVLAAATPDVEVNNDDLVSLSVLKAGIITTAPVNIMVSIG